MQIGLPLQINFQKVDVPGTEHFAFKSCAQGNHIVGLYPRAAANDRCRAPRKLQDILALLELVHLNGPELYLQVPERSLFRRR